MEGLPFHHIDKASTNGSLWPLMSSPRQRRSWHHVESYIYIIYTHSIYIEYTHTMYVYIYIQCIYTLYEYIYIYISLICINRYIYTNVSIYICVLHTDICCNIVYYIYYIYVYYTLLYIHSTTWQKSNHAMPRCGPPRLAGSSRWWPGEAPTGPTSDQSWHIMGYRQ